MQVQWGSEHSSKITQHHAVKVYSDWELQSTVGVQTVLSAKWAATPGALLVTSSSPLAASNPKFCCILPFVLQYYCALMSMQPECVINQAWYRLYALYAC